ncbi:PorT family protein [Flavobacterium album]|uniref:PorT family protein n=1 Tax=Flavobacterium album TaxID=2175091 RepID=A0A2S1QTG8_9FLAO|nr:porin family protein [Flavobacterium album]AWH83664.1 PorT family protein [Flavobacterium album]
MKKIIFLLTALAGSFAMQAQGIDFGIKAGANFANFTGGDINTKSITNFHAGAVVELNLVPVFSVQAEALFSSQGATYKDTALDIAKDINLKYVSVPVMAKFYVLPKLSVMAGPQFSFLVDDADEAFDSKKFDLAASGGVELKVIAGLFAQARYNIGLTKVSDSEYAGDAKNAVFQLSLGYYF